LAEMSGVNMVQVAPGCVDFVAKYRKERGGKLQMMVCVDVDQSDVGKVKAQIRELIDKGVETLYTHGERTDRQVMAGNVDAVGRKLDLIKAAGVPGGIGSHSLETPIASEKHGLSPDYYVKTCLANFPGASLAGQSRWARTLLLISGALPCSPN